MASLAAYSAIKAYLSPLISVDTAWPNEAFERPIAVDGSLDPFVIVELNSTSFGQQSIGANTQAENRWDEEGTFWAHLFVAAGTGLDVVLALADTIKDALRGTTLLSGDLEFGDVETLPGEPGDEDGAYYRISLMARWRRLEI